ncbi:tetratricopeptide repeat protein [Ruegeria halocynthiae]|uniref:tetratricopeptide repeat protein n=1 Tax=Ruegeria halocynthiae TaxID=985054 RepID=UPI0009E06F3D|nr:tetratricopeptide repeat protein [Ruegeria halocynthiae]
MRVSTLAALGVPIAAVIFVASWYALRPFEIDEATLRADCETYAIPPIRTVEACTALLSKGEASVADRTNFLLWRGHAYRNLGEVQKANADVTEVLNFDPNHLNALISRGYLRSDAGRFSEAIEDFSRAISVDPQKATTFKRRATIYYNNGKMDLALADYTRALELDPTYEEAAGDIANVLFVQERYDEAIENLRRFVVKWPENAGFQGTLGFLLYNYTDEYAEALEAFYKHDELLPSLVSKYIFPAMVYFKAREPLKARKLIEIYAEKLDEKNRQNAPAAARFFRSFGLDGEFGRDIQIFYRSQALARAGQVEAATREYNVFEKKFGVAARLAASEEILRNGVTLDKKRATQENDYFAEKLELYFTELSKLGNW